MARTGSFLGSHIRKGSSMANIIAGKKTYITAAVMVALAAAEFTGVQVPPSVWILLNGLGLGFLRQAVAK